MKPHLVIICGILYPNPSPTGLCAARYAALLKDKYDIEFISLSSNGKEETVIYDGCQTHTIASKRLRLEYKLKGFLRKIIHLIGSAQLKFSIHGNLGWFRKTAFDKLVFINEKRPIDALLTVCSPLPAHMAGADFKRIHPNVRFCAYTVDPFAASDRIIPFLRTFNDFVELEKQVSASADCLFLSEEAIASRTDVYGELNNKIALPYLLPEYHEIEGGLFQKDSIHCVYAGSFYHDIRNPEYMLKVFSSLTDKKIKLHLYCSGCEDIVNRYKDNPNIIVNGYVSQEELKKVYASCDFLIGVGNKMNDFLPSKTYEYLSLRKPIVFFNPLGYHNEVLKQYPYSLQITDNLEISEAATQFEGFVSEEAGKTISKEDLDSLYYKNTDQNIRSILLKGLKKRKQ